jgi:hypothetical protein
MIYGPTVSKFRDATALSQTPKIIKSSPLCTLERRDFIGFPFPRSSRMLRLADPWNSQGGTAMKRIKIPRRPGHELDADADDCLAFVNWAGIPAHMG